MDPDVPLRVKAVTYILNQSPVFALIILILFGIWDFGANRLPLIVSQMNDLYLQQSVNMKEAAAVYKDTATTAVDRLIASLEQERVRDREMFLELADRNRREMLRAIDKN